MGQFTLPSGRVVETRDPEEFTWGDELHVISLGLTNPEEFTYAKIALVVPTLKRNEVSALSRADGRALSSEVSRIFDGRPLERDTPFDNGSQPDSKDTATSLLTPEHASTNTDSAGV